MIVGVVATVLIVAGGILYFTTRNNTPATASGPVDSSGTAASSAAGTTAPAAPATPCTYTATGASKAVKAVKVPSNTSPANTGTLDATIKLNGEDVAVTLDRAAAPCTVNSFVSLASQGFFDSSPCWRLTGNSALYILQCGDPSGVGNGGPGYTFADELTKTKTYPKGTIAMANSGTGTNGSQFFIVYQDSTLSPQYTVFGKVSDAGMKVVDAIAAQGIKGNSQDGAPNAKAVIDSVTVPADAVAASGVYATASAGASGSAGAGETAVSSAPAASAAPTAN